MKILLVGALTQRPNDGALYIVRPTRMSAEAQVG